MKRLLVLLVALFIVAAACGSDDDDSSGDGDAKVNPNGVLVVGDNLTGSGFSQRLQPDLMTSVCDFAFGNPVFSTLVYLNPSTGEVSPGLAQSWDIVDARTVKFTLRPNLTFHDGTKLDAAAAKAGLDKNKAGRLASTMVEIDTITVDTPTTFTIKLKSDSAAIVPVTLAGREGMIAAAASTDTRPIGAGPFKFASQQIGAEIKYEKFDGYWDAAKVRLAGVTIVNTGTEASVGSNALKAGEIDAAYYYNPAALEEIQGDTNVTITSRPSLSYHKINVNTSRGPWTNLKFRQAMQHATDRDAIATVLFGKGNYETAWMPFPSTFELAYSKASAEKYKFDPAKAKSLIAESGLSTPIKTTAYFPAGSAIWQQFAEIVQSQWKAVGVEVELLPTTNGVRDYLTEHKADAFLLLWPPRPDPTVTVQRQFGLGQLNNTGNFETPKLKAAIDTMRGSTDEAKVRAAYVDADKEIVDNALEIAIGFPIVSLGQRTWVTGEVREYESCQGMDFTKLAVTDAKK